MPIKALLDPENASESALGFKEGLVRVEQSVHKVHQPKAGEGQTSDRNPFLALVWQCTRLEEDSKEPMRDGDGNPVTEEVVFSFGATSLSKAHPGLADDADSDDIEDAGVEVNSEGPSVFLVDPNWFPNKKSGIVHLMESLKEKGLKKEQLARVWAPDWVGAVLYLKSKVADDKMWRPNPKKGNLLEEVAYSYKVVDRIERGPRQGVEKKPRAKGATVNGKDAESEAEIQIKPLLDQISQEKTGKSMTKKALIAHVNTMGNEFGLQKQMLGILNLVKDDNWLIANGHKYDFTFNPNDNSIAFS